MTDKYLYWDHDFSRKYAHLSGCRWPTMQMAMNMLLNVEREVVIVETGCQRQDDDWGGGCSTLLFAEFAKLRKYPTRVVSVDNNPKHIAVSRQILADKGLDHYVHHHCDDSSGFLRSWSMRHEAGQESPIDLLYLDSYDYPYGLILDAYGGKEDIQAAIAAAQAMPTAEVVERHGARIIPCQQHCWRELRASLPSLHVGAVILIDDNDLAGGGKSRMAKSELAGMREWVCLADTKQTLWVKL